MAGLKRCFVIFTAFIICYVEAESQCYVTTGPLNWAQWKGELEMRQEPENGKGYYIDSLYVKSTLSGEAKFLDEDENVLETISFIGRQNFQKSFPTLKFFHIIEFSLKGEAGDAELSFETAGCEPKDLKDAQP